MVLIKGGYGALMEWCDAVCDSVELTEEERCGKIWFECKFVFVN